MMRKKLRMLSIIVCSALLYYALPVFADNVPARLSFQGRLADVNGNPVTGTKSIVFNIYNEDEDTVLWTETQPTVSVSNGIFNVNLGDVSPIPTSLFPGATRYLEINVAGDGAMAPKIMFVSNGYAFCADTLDGYEYAHFVSTVGAQTIEGTKTFTSDVIASSLTVSGARYISDDGTSMTINGGPLQITSNNNLKIDGTGIIHFDTPGANVTYLAENYGIEARGDATHPVQVVNSALVMGDITEGSWNPGTIYVGTQAASLGLGTITIDRDNIYCLWEDFTGNPMLRINRDTGISFGATTTGLDTNLYRSAADTLKTDDSLIVGMFLGLTTRTLDTIQTYTKGGDGVFQQYFNSTEGWKRYLDIVSPANDKTSAIRFINQTVADTDPTESMRIDTTGFVGISTGSPQTMFHVGVGSISVTEMPTLAVVGNVLYADDDGIIGYTSSSKRYKENIRDLDIKKEDVLKLNPVRFTWKSSGEEDVGLIAEDVNDIIKDLVIYDKEARPNGVKYEKVAVYLISAIKEQQKEIEALKSEIAELKRSQ